MYKNNADCEAVAACLGTNWPCADIVFGEGFFFGDCTLVTSPQFSIADSHYP
jgi:hypothetical protein